MAEGEGSFVVNGVGSGEFAFCEIVAADALDSPEEDGAWLDVVSDDGRGEGAAFFERCG